MVVHLLVSLTLRRGTMRNGIPDVLQSITLLTSSSSVVQVGALLPIGLCLIWLKATIFFLGKEGFIHGLHCNFHWLNIKAILAHDPVIQKEVWEHLAKGAVQPSTDGTGVYSNVFVVSKHLGGLHPTLNVK